VSDVIHTPGHEALWGWFGLSYASFCVLPRVLMCAMPDEWQAKMAALLEEYEETFPGASDDDMPSAFVSAKKDQKFTKWPEWVLRYRYPDFEEIERRRKRS